MTDLGIVWIVIGGVILLILLLVSCYKKTGPNYALIVSGLTKKPRHLIGKGGFVIPILERVDKLYLGAIPVDIKTKESIPTNDFIDVKVDAVAMVSVDSSSREKFELAVKNFLNYDSKSIENSITDIFESNLRESVGAICLKELTINRDAFSDQVLSKASTDLGALGLKVLSTNIQNISDQHGAIQNLGVENLERIKKDASINKANALKEVAIAEAKAKQEANDVRVASETSIAEKNNELAIKQADLKKASDTKRAEADAAYSIMQQDQQAIINQKTVDAEIEKTKRQQVLSDENVKVVENTYRAEINKKSDAQKYAAEVAADADKYQVERRAEADLEQRKKKAEAELFEAEKKAAAIKAQAEADKYSKLQAAEGIAAIGEAEAKAIAAKGVAEAEALEKKAEAYEKFGQAAILDMVVKILPEMAGKVAEPISSIESVRIYDGGIDKMSANVPAVLKQTFDTIKDVTGVDMADVMKKDTLAAKTDRNINIDLKD